MESKVINEIYFTKSKYVTNICLPLNKNHIKKKEKNSWEEFSCGIELRIWHCHCSGLSHCGGTGLILGLGSSTAVDVEKKKKRRRKRSCEFFKEEVDKIAIMESNFRPPLSNPGNSRA